MKKLLLVGALTLGVTSCTPDIAQDPAPVVAEFDPSASPAVVPSPNDLAIDSTTGLVNAPIDPKSPAANQEFTKDYLNTLDGFPTSLAATTKIADLDPASVSTTSVRFIDLLKGTPIATADVTPTLSYDADSDQLIIAPPATGWPKGGRYAVALIGGDNGLKGVGGRKVVGSPVWGFASLDRPLVTCEDLTAPDCKSTTDLIPAESKDPVIHAQEQTAAALQLEQLRRAYKPLLDSLAAQGVNRDDIVLLWTFRIMNKPEATFDPANSVIPFPNNILLATNEDGSQHVNLPISSDASPLEQQLFAGLNTLDGFSTTSPIVSENSDSLGVIDTGSKLDANSLATGTLFAKVTATGAVPVPTVTPCLNCASSGGPTSTPQQLQFVPHIPLDEHSTYAAVMTSALKDEKGRFLAPTAAFALMRLSNPLAVDGKSQVTGVSDDQATQLEPLRAGFKSLFDGLTAASLPRSKIVLAWAFTTQSTVSVLKQLHDLPKDQYGPAGLPDQPVYLADITHPFVDNMAAAGLNNSNIGKVFQGSIVLPFLLTGTEGTLNPASPRFVQAPFLLALPASAAPADGYPVTIFSHGLRSGRLTATPLINELASSKYATIAIDTVFHGDRSTCAGITAAAGLPGIDTPDKACLTGGHCDVDPASVTYGRCISSTRNTCSLNPATPLLGDYACAQAGQGRCIKSGSSDPTAGVCEGSAFKTDANGVPYISGWNMLNLTNLFATRDNFRQHTVDHAQVARVLTSAGINTQLAANGAGKIDGTKINYVGQSLGGVLGPLYTSVSPDVSHAVFNVPGGDLTDVLLTSPAFESAKESFLATLASANPDIKPGAPAFDQFIGLAKMILDPADPINYIYSVENGADVPAGRAAFIQYIDQDQVIPNTTTEALIASANRSESAKQVSVFKYTPTAAFPLDKRHAFLLDSSGDSSVTLAAQSQVVYFLDNGTLQ